MRRFLVVGVRDMEGMDVRYRASDFPAPPSTRDALSRSSSPPTSFTTVPRYDIVTLHRRLTFTADGTCVLFFLLRNFQK